MALGPRPSMKCDRSSVITEKRAGKPIPMPWCANVWLPAACQIVSCEVLQQPKLVLACVCGQIFACGLTPTAVMRKLSDRLHLQKITER